jgi:hypothetical protein
MSLETQCTDVLRLILSYLSIKDIVKIETLAKKFNGVYNYTKVQQSYIKVEKTKYKLFQELTEYLEDMRKEIIDTNNYKNLSKWGKIYRNINNQSGWWQFYFITVDNIDYNKDAERNQFELVFNESFNLPDEIQGLIVDMINNFVTNIMKKPLIYVHKYEHYEEIYNWFSKK